MENLIDELCMNNDCGFCGLGHDCCAECDDLEQPTCGECGAELNTTNTDDVCDSCAM
ncbi:MAG: hypothetical protein GY757_09985 [bacterium]|nr:hypothetical protein [bacterium]